MSKHLPSNPKQIISFSFAFPILNIFSCIWHFYYRLRQVTEFVSERDVYKEKFSYCSLRRKPRMAFHLTKPSLTTILCSFNAFFFPCLCTRSLSAPSFWGREKWKRLLSVLHLLPGEIVLCGEDRRGFLQPCLALLCIKLLHYMWNISKWLRAWKATMYM